MVLIHRYLQALADTLRSFSAEYLAVSIIAVRERHGQIFLAAELPGLIKVSFPKINLCRSGIPDQFQVCFLRLDGTAFLHVALDNAVTPGIAMFLHETLIDSLSGMVLLSPMFLVFVQPLLDDGLEGIQLGWLLLDNGWLWREVILCKVLAYRFGISSCFFRNFTDPVSTIAQVIEIGRAHV